MVLVRAQHQWNHQSGLAKDVSINTFYFLGPGSDTSGAVGLAEAVRDFYDTFATGGNKITGYLHGDAMADLRHTVKLYNMNTAPPRVPYYEITTDDPAGMVSAAAGLPHEVAMCMSYKATPTSGANAKRRRGRIYLGPLNISAMDESETTNVVRPAAAFRATILGAAQQFKDAIETVGYEWVGFSPTTHDSTGPVVGEAAIFPINIVSVDDAFDTQRRRGEDRSLVQSVTLT